MLAGHGRKDPDRAKIEQIHRAAQSATALTRQLLAFSRKQVLHPQVVDVNTLIGHAVQMLSRILGDNILLEMTLAPHLCTVKVDPMQLEQVLVNLAANARDAMPYGGTLLFSTENAVLMRAMRASTQTFSRAAMPCWR